MSSLLASFPCQYAVIISSLFLKTTVCGERNQTSGIAAGVNPHFFEMRAAWSRQLLFYSKPHSESDQIYQKGKLSLLFWPKKR